MYKQNRSNAYQTAMSVQSAHPEVGARLASVSESYRRHYHDRVMERGNAYHRYYHNGHYRYFYSQYFPYGFCGGYWYPCNPFWDIDLYFGYPIVYWFYLPTPEQTVYQAYYPTEYPQNPVAPFQFAGTFYPTETLRDLGVEISGLSYEVQGKFRQAVTTLTLQLVKQISETLKASFTLADNEVVLTRYENLQNRAIVVEGFVDRGDMHIAFKGDLDLNDPSKTTVFVPSAEVPSPADISALKAVNDRIIEQGGDPFIIHVEPEQMPNS